ncbi:tRNA (5-methylaminomethyl-2-thiouridylate)-methyltransferase [Bradymonas sediminis]|nr:tRNA 2-thiouridine(34) synthase MnmA [Bradymonas sediminis]TDP76535.1 tRNA (5-methylaminomethyl-2-thiouridylate)-methyltransferase [Bradymonas sediminis]
MSVSDKISINKPANWKPEGAEALLKKNAPKTGAHCAVDLPPMLDDDTAISGAVEGRVVVAMSGGVDSSVAAALLAEAGYDAVGISMRLYATPQENYTKSCCSPDDLFDARTVASSLGIPFYVANYQDAFKERVIDYFIDEYRYGRTPNPCVACNNHLKFDILLKRSLALGATFLATGHYARIDRSGEHPVMRMGVDRTKDQSYFLFGIPREALNRIIFPLGGLEKDEVRAEAHRLDIETADKPESHDICFVAGGDYKDFVAERLGKEKIQPGKIVLPSGEVLGEHDGIHNFTVGQRRGLGVSYNEPLFVHSIRPSDGTVVVGPKGSAFSTALVADRCNWLSFERPPRSFECTVKTRYHASPVPAMVTVGDDPTIATVEFLDPQGAVSPGQAAVFYRGDEVLGGGWIGETRG